MQAPSQAIFKSRWEVLLQGLLLRQVSGLCYTGGSLGDHTGPFCPALCESRAAEPQPPLVEQSRGPFPSTAHGDALLCSDSKASWAKVLVFLQNTKQEPHGPGLPLSQERGPDLATTLNTPHIASNRYRRLLCKTLCNASIGQTVLCTKPPRGVGGIKNCNDPAQPD